MAITRKLKLAFTNNIGGTTTKIFNNAKAKDDIDTVDIVALMESMIDNSDIFTVSLVDATGATVITTESEELALA